MRRAGRRHRIGRARTPTPQRHPRAFGERIRAAQDSDLILKLLVDWLTQAHARTAAISQAIREAAAVDPEAAELEQTLAGQRFSGYRQAAHASWPGAAGCARASAHQAAATIWSLGHPETYRYLRHRRD